jgi:glucose-6-phosphate isomerase
MMSEGDPKASAQRAAIVKAWQYLHALASRPRCIGELLTDVSRNQGLLLEAAGLQLDFTHQAIDADVQQALLALASVCDVAGQAQAMARGEPINATERRPALHMALRVSDHSASSPWGEAISRAVIHERKRFLSFADAVRSGGILTAGRHPVESVVNIGIGGSDLGPRMATAALAPGRASRLRLHYLSNPDPWALAALLEQIVPDRTLFIVQSKTFSTQETLTILDSITQWLREQGLNQPLQSMVAVTANADRALARGFAAEQCFSFWDWVGGRYSVWSAIGLPLAIAIGSKSFEAFLAGAAHMDAHLMSAPPPRNAPLMMALTGIWNRNLLGRSSLACLPYDSRLELWPRFLQQLEMESLGKRVDIHGQPLERASGPVVWGGLGIDGQHAFYQLLHQGTDIIPVDFVEVLDDDPPLSRAAVHRDLVRVNLQAQRQALALGRDEEQTARALAAEGLSPENAARLTPHRTYPGNRPSTLIRLPRLDPASLGALIALYEHKVFYQAAIWNLHAFDQWGVELGKTLAQALSAKRD